MYSDVYTEQERTYTMRGGKRYPCRIQRRHDLVDQ
jgi:hypothetical protein